MSVRLSELDYCTHNDDFLQTSHSDSESKRHSSPINIFDNLPALKSVENFEDELDRFLSTEREVGVVDGLAWWFERKHIYPRLSRMAMDYLSIPGIFIYLFPWNPYLQISATSVDVERTFSQGRLVLSHVRSRLSVQSTRALLCLGEWSAMGLVNDDDVKSAATLPEVKGEEDELKANWDTM